uniref:Uncharacterized protein n=1 Tax=Arundo donax TaxID=35708 RepID=A0A0A9FVZ2_ARUDO
MMKRFWLILIYVVILTRYNISV